MNNKLVDTFLGEAHELIVDIEKSLLDLEGGSFNKESISSIFRAMHTLKGAGSMFGYEAVATITHHLESIYQDIRDDKRSLNSEILSLTFKTLDQLRILLQESAEEVPGDEYNELLQSIKVLEQDQTTPSVEIVSNPIIASKEATYYIFFHPHKDIFRNGTNPLYLVDDLLVLGNGISMPFIKDLPSLQDMVCETCYMGFEVVLSTAKAEDEIQSVFLFVEGSCDLTIKKLADENLVANCEQLSSSRKITEPIGFDAIKSAIQKKESKRTSDLANKVVKAKSGNIRVSAERLDELMNLVSELVITQARLSLFSDHTNSQELGTISENIEKITRRLRDNAFIMSLVPLDSIAVRFQRLVNDLSKELNKQVIFKTEGLETKIDKSIIEKLIDPILHILRNCIDHGVEKPEEREHVGKQAQGTVTLKSYYSGSHVVIEIGDDGAGLKLDVIRQKAIERGLIQADAHLTEKELTEIIFLPGFSTASAITGVSGRGVGMDVVRRNIADIRGEIEVNTSQGQGSTFIIRLPLTLSILDGLLVKIGATDFILPLSSVAKCHEVETTQLESTFNHWITLDGKRTPFIYLREEFQIHNDKPTYSQVINVPFNGSYVGIAVDKILGEYQAVLKPLGKHYNEQDEFSGATILGDGSVALVLDPNKLIKKCQRELTTIKN